ncbi:MAG TPA: hypothetical protein VF960_03390 [Chloroflexota bacterium]
MTEGSSAPPAGPTGSIQGNLWLARDVSAIGNWILFLSLLDFLYTFTDSPSMVGSLFLLWALPGFLLGPIARRFVTWRNATAFGVTAQLLRAMLVLPLYFFDQNDGTQPILLLALAAGIVAPFAGAANRALLHAVLAPGQRATAETALRTTWLLTAAVGPGLSYIIYGVSGLRSAATAVLVAYLLSGALLFLSRPTRQAEEAGQEVLPVFAPIPLRLAGAFSSPAARQVAALEVASALLVGGVLVLEAAYTTSGLLVGIENFSMVLAGQGLGMMIGGFFYFRFGRQFTHNVLAAGGLALLGGGEVGLAISTGLDAGLGLGCAIGAGIAVLGLALSDLGSRVALSEGREMSRGLGTSVLVEGVAVLSVAIAGPLAESLSPRFALVLVGILCVVLALYTFGSAPEADRSTNP